MADILIVEDDKSINELIRRTVRMTGHRGLPVHDGREALKAVDQKVPDLILLDMNLPDISGFELLKQWKQIPVICVTARGEIEDRVRGLNGGGRRLYCEALCSRGTCSQNPGCSETPAQGTDILPAGQRGSGYGEGCSQERRNTGGADNQGI